jgi:hypothetical protein
MRSREVLGDTNSSATVPTSYGPVRAGNVTLNWQSTGNDDKRRRENNRGIFEKAILMCNCIYLDLFALGCYSLYL